MQEPDAPLRQPACDIPLSVFGLMVLGRINVIWAQIETSIDMLLRDLDQLDKRQFDDFYFDRQIERKLTALQRRAARSSDNAERVALIEFCKAMRTVIVDRNHAVHGRWGYIVDAQGRIEGVGAHSPKRRDNAFKADQLVQLHNSIADASLMADDLCIALLGHGPRSSDGRRFFFGLAPPAGFECTKCQEERLEHARKENF
jgi:hypothetical protein